MVYNTTFVKTMCTICFEESLEKKYSYEDLNPITEENPITEDLQSISICSECGNIFHEP